MGCVCSSWFISAKEFALVLLESRSGAEHEEDEAEEEERGDRDRSRG